MIEKELEGFRKLHPDERHKGPATYVIKCSESNDFYVGSTGNLVKRLISHYSHLKTEKHPNKKLQKIYNSSLENPFNVYVKEATDQEEALNNEQALLDMFKHNPALINISINARSANGGRLLSEEHRTNIGKGNVGKKLSPETIEKLRQANLNNPHRDKLNEAQKINNLGGKNPNSRLVLCYGVVYGSCTEAAKALGISRASMTRKVRNERGSDSFCQYIYIYIYI